ncbi:MAG: hypothetical protein Tp172DCM1112201_2 [Prokaryotic dsDNA virus sp.]|nr:MAG: hypothetical protein Tp172DCM1112201_2 [Prokaryotic dsDNA virus sp.]
MSTKYKQAADARRVKRTTTHTQISQNKDGSMKLTPIKGKLTGLAKPSGNT